MAITLLVCTHGVHDLSPPVTCLGTISECMDPRPHIRRCRGNCPLKLSAPRTMVHQDAEKGAYRRKAVQGLGLERQRTYLKYVECDLAHGRGAFL